jgi:hypothetical protein
VHPRAPGSATRRRLGPEVGHRVAARGDGRRGPLGLPQPPARSTGRSSTTARSASPRGARWGRITSTPCSGSLRPGHPAGAGRSGGACSQLFGKPRRRDRTGPHPTEPGHHDLRLVRTTRPSRWSSMISRSRSALSACARARWRRRRRSR